MAFEKTTYETHVKPFLKEIGEMKEMGFTDDEVVANLHICKATLYKYKREHPELAEQFKKSFTKIIMNNRRNLVRQGIDNPGAAIYLDKYYGKSTTKYEDIMLQLKEMELKNKELENQIEMERLKNSNERNAIVDDIFKELGKSAE